MIQIPTEADLEALIAEAYEEAAAADGDDGAAEAAAVADAFAALALPFDAALRPVLAAAARLNLDPDRDGRIEASEGEALAAAAAAAGAVLAGRFVANALGPYLAAVLQAQGGAGEEVLRPVPARLSARFGGPDPEGARWLERHESYWVTRYGERIAEPRIARLLRAQALAGPSDAKAAQALLEGLGAEYEKGLTYWKLVAVAGAHRAGTLARVDALIQAGVPGRYSTVRDDRRSKVCAFLAGRRVPLAALREYRTAMLTAATPAQAQAASMWWTEKTLPDLRERVHRNGGNVPPEAMPGNHGHCRSIIVADPSAA